MKRSSVQLVISADPKSDESMTEWVVLLNDMIIWKVVRSLEEVSQATESDQNDRPQDFKIEEQRSTGRSEDEVWGVSLWTLCTLFSRLSFMTSVFITKYVASSTFRSFMKLIIPHFKFCVFNKIYIMIIMTTTLWLQLLRCPPLNDCLQYHSKLDL